MISLNDVLLAMSNIPVDDPIAEIWGRGLQSGYKIIEYTGTFPITINANGYALLDYRIYGTDGGVGEVTEQLFDISNTETNKYIDTTTGEVKNASTGGYVLSDYIDVSNMNAIVMSSTVGANVSGAGGHLNLYDASKNWLRGHSTYQASPANTKKSFLADVSNASYVRVDYASRFLLQNSLIEGSTAPTSYIPYGYKLPMTVSDGNTEQTVPVYIGENQLDAGEYVSYSDGKIYRMVDGTLTPTDPPVPLPEIPTIDGTTVIDYDGDPKPSQMYIKYKGKG